MASGVAQVQAYQPALRSATALKTVTLRRRRVTQQGGSKATRKTTVLGLTSDKRSYEKSRQMSVGRRNQRGNLVLHASQSAPTGTSNNNVSEMSRRMKEVFVGWVKIVTSAFSSASIKQAFFKKGVIANITRSLLVLFFLCFV
jgi:hypothetical protein